MNTFILVLLFTVATADITDFAARNQEFTKALINETIIKQTLVSPFSIQATLAFAQSGTGGITGEEIRKNAFLKETKEETETEMKEVLSTIGTTVKHRVYYDPSLEPNEGFKTLANDTYGTSFADIKFANDIQAASDINYWVSLQTNGQFYDSFIQNPSLDKFTKDVLINIVSVQKPWSSRFDSAITSQETFYYTEYDDNKTQDVDMMTQGPLMYNYFDSKELDAQILEMAAEDDTTVTIVLPNEISGLSKIRDQIELALTTPEYTQQFLQLSLPRKDIVFVQTHSFRDLQGLGIQTMFTENADFSGVSAQPGDLSATDLLHNAYVKFSESGIEVETGGALAVNFDSSKHFNVNHPFFFYVKVKGVVVLVGIVDKFLH